MSEAIESHSTNSNARRPHALHRALILLACLAYVGVTAYYGVRHVLGDTSQIAESPAGYFFTWDMFPGYETESTRRTVVGRAGERFVQLLPATSHRYRYGVNAAATRLDIDARRANLTPTLEPIIARYNAEHPQQPIEEVFIVEEYRPAKFNLPDDLYEQVYGEPKPQRSYLRIGQSLRVVNGKLVRYADKTSQRAEP